MMSICNCKRSCTLIAVIASVIIGVVAAFLQITGVITVAPVFLWAALGVAIVYLGVLVVAAALAGDAGGCGSICTVLSALLTGILGTILFSLVLLAVGIVATSVVSAILVGLVLGFFALAISSTACLVRCLTDCAE